MKTRFRALGTPERAAGEKAYMKSGLRFHAVKTSVLREACRDFCRAHPAMSRADAVAIVEALHAADYFDLRSAGHAARMSGLTLREATKHLEAP